jgi:hypothetical protein
MGRMAMLVRFEYEYEYRDAEYEYEKKLQSWSPATSATTVDEASIRFDKDLVRYCLLSVSSRLRITRAASVQAAASWGLIP